MKVNKTFSIWMLVLTVTSVSMLCSKVYAYELTIAVENPQQKIVSDVVVYVTPVKGIDNLVPNTKPLYIDQLNSKFSPYITVLQKGQSINFKNKDDITHHIYSVSGGNRFQFKIQSGHTHETQKLGSAEEIAMGCNIHDWMNGYALVVDTPFFGKTDQQGKVKINLPEQGDYEVTIWHPQLDVEQNRVTKRYKIAETHQQITFELPKKLLPIPEQSGQDDFDFLDGY